MNEQGRIQGLVWAHGNVGTCYGNVAYIYKNDTLLYI